MDWLNAIILGAVQGITEFLPISSDGHLVLASALLGVNATLDMTVLLHLGSLAAIAIVFRRDVRALVFPRIDWHGLMVLAIASIPAVIVGLTLKILLPKATGTEVERSVMQSPLWAAGGLIFTAAMLWTAEIKREPSVTLANVRGGGYLGVLLIGCMQALAILPGVSRSGSTISTALALKWLRPEAVRLSFMMGLIAITGAGLLEAKEIAKIEPVTGICGFVSSFVFSLFGLWAVRLVVLKGKLRWFAAYCLVLGVGALVYLLVVKRS
ncbi:MAG: undecaprenyl-diphosphate phosphatase [Planctomycetes bacterium]|nr:undecaprenyl-diphosphate phosphatase [Planctomycetota bacterium]